MREELDYLLELCLELCLRELESVLPKDVVGVCSQDLGHSELTNLKVDERLEALGSLDLKGGVALEAVLHDVHEFIEHFDELVYD